MKNFLLEEICLISHLEKRARRVKFNQKATVVKGKNDTGKSSLIKSIYSCFGASPKKVHPRWKSSNAHCMLTFKVNDDRYRLLRIGGYYNLFGKNDYLIGTYKGAMRGILPKLSEIFDFRIKLADKKNNIIIPPIDYFFVPFYIDQDDGWSTNWSSFAGLYTIPNWKKDIAYYHTGIRPNAYYSLRGKISDLENKQKEPITKEKALRGVRADLEKKINIADFDIDINAYKNEINRLLVECERLKKAENKYKGELTNLETEKVRLEAQQEIVLKAQLELSEDYKYATDMITDDVVHCPMCGQEHNNLFSERFSIAEDEDRCVGLLSELKVEISEVKSKITQCKQKFETKQSERQEIEKLLSVKKGKISLKKLIENEGKKEIAKTIDADIEELYEKIIKISLHIKKYQEEIKLFEDRKRTKNITEEYRELIKKFLWKLDVTSLSDKTCKNMNCSIRETGSDLPRAILAYTFALLNVIRSNGTGTFCPIIIDSPNQQDQDRENHIKMLKFIRDNIPENSQLILGLVDDCNIDFGGDIVEMEERDFALYENEYSDTVDYIQYYEKSFLDS